MDTYAQLKDLIERFNAQEARLAEAERRVEEIAVQIGSILEERAEPCAEPEPPSALWSEVLWESPNEGEV